MWIVYYPDGTLASSDTYHWTDIATPQDIVTDRPDQTIRLLLLQRPASEMRLRSPDGTTWYRLKAPYADGVAFFHFSRGRFDLANGNGHILFEAAGYLIDGGPQRLVLEVASGMTTTRIETGSMINDA